MSVVNTIKDRVIEKLESLDSVQAVYPAHKTNPSGWPCVFVRTTDLEGTFSSNAENSRVFGFELTILFPLSQDMVDEAERERLDYAERVLNDVMDEAIDAFDRDFTLGDDPILYVEAADCQWGYMDIEAGEAEALRLILKIYTERVVL